MSARSRRTASAVLSLAALAYGSAGRAGPLVEGLAQQAAASCDPADATCLDTRAQALSQLGALASQVCAPGDQGCVDLQSEASAALALTAAATAAALDTGVTAPNDPNAIAQQPVAAQGVVDNTPLVASFLATTVCPPYAQECADGIAQRVSVCMPGDDGCLSVVAKATLEEAHRATMAAVCDETTCQPGEPGVDGPSWQVVSDPGCAACPTTCVQGWVVHTDPGGITNTVRGDVLLERAVDGIVGQIPWFQWTHTGVITANDLGAPTYVRHTDMDMDAVHVDYSALDAIAGSVGVGSAYGSVRLSGAELEHGAPGIGTSDVMARFVPGYHHPPSSWQGAAVLHAGTTSAKQFDARNVASWEEAQPNGSIHYSVYSYESQSAAWSGTTDHWSGAAVAGRGSNCSSTVAIATGSIGLTGSSPIASIYTGDTQWEWSPDYLAGGGTVYHDIGTRATAHLLNDYVFGKARGKITSRSVNILGVWTPVPSLLSSSAMDDAARGVADQVVNCFAFAQHFCDRMDGSWTSAGASISVAPDHIVRASNSPWRNSTEPAHIIPVSTYSTHTGRWYCPVPVGPIDNGTLQVLPLATHDDGGPRPPPPRLCYQHGEFGWGFYPCSMVAVASDGEAG